MTLIVKTCSDCGGYITETMTCRGWERDLHECGAWVLQCECGKPTEYMMISFTEGHWDCPEHGLVGTLSRVSS